MLKTVDKVKDGIFLGINAYSAASDTREAVTGSPLPADDWADRAGALGDMSTIAKEGFKSGGFSVMGLGMFVADQFMKSSNKPDKPSRGSDNSSEKKTNSKKPKNTWSGTPFIR